MYKIYTERLKSISINKNLKPFQECNKITLFIISVLPLEPSLNYFDNYENCNPLKIYHINIIRNFVRYYKLR